MAEIEDEQRSLEEMFHKLVWSLSFNDKVTEVHFMMTKPLYKIIHYTRNLVELHQNIKILDKPKKNKRPTTARKYRLKGDRALESGCFIKAIECYNKSIINAEFAFSTKASHESSSESSTESSSESKSEHDVNDIELSYMGRANSLFRIDLTNECRKDVFRSMEHGDGTMPTKMKDQIFNRHMAKITTLSAYKNLQDWLSKIPIIDGEPFITKELEIFIQKVDADKINETFEIAPGKEYVALPPVLLQIIKDRNPNIPSLSSAVDVEFCDKKGRYLSAKRDIEPGELLIYEDRFVSVLFHDYLETHCTYCLSRTYLPIPCAVCTEVVYCCEECRESAWTNFHSVECKILPILRKLNMGANSLMSLRLVIFMGLKSLKENIPTFKKETFRLRSRQTLGFGRNGIYSSNDYRSIYTMKTMHKLQGSFLFFACVSAHALLELLEMSDFFKLAESCNGRRDKTFIYEVLIDQILISSVNACSITETVIKDGNVAQNLAIGSSLSSVYSLANHSCEPSSHVFFYPGAIAVRATKYISKTQEITVSYCKPFGFLEQDLVERQNLLKSRYEFDCSCNACDNNWGKLETLNDEIYFLCKACRYVSTINADSCLNCSSIEMPDAIKDIREILASPEWERAKTSVETCEDVDIVKRLISHLCKHALQPCLIFFIAQLILKRFYDCKQLRHVEHPSSTI